MINWVTVALCIIFVSLGILCGIWVEKVSKKPFGKIDGLLYIKKGEGVYFQAVEDPMGYTDGQLITLEVCLADKLPGQSQEEQGRE